MSEEDEVELASEHVLAEIDAHVYSSPEVDRQTTRAFWENIVDGLKTRIDALVAYEGAADDAEAGGELE